MRFVGAREREEIRFETEATLWQRLLRRLHPAVADSSQRRPDLILLAVVAVLLTIGLDMVYSATFVIAHNNPQYGSDTYFLMRQLTWTGLGAIAMLVTATVDYHRWRRLSVPVLGIVIVMLMVILVSRLGHSAYGAQRWLQLGPLPAMQPSEFAKLALILYYADWLAQRPNVIGRFSAGTLPFGLILAFVCALVILQPDLGSTIVIAATAVCLFFVAGADLRHLIGGLLFSGGALVLLILGASYRSQRISAFLDPSKDPLGIGWNITQAAIALGSGGAFGRGLGASRQKFYYLPSAQTDAIFAVIGEELGFIGTVGILVLFAVVAYRGFRISIEAPDRFGALLAAGITCWIVIQALINIGVITGTIPFTGIPLPFVSFGGSALIMTMTATGMLVNVSRHLPIYRADRQRHRGAEPSSYERI